LPVPTWIGPLGIIGTAVGFTSVAMSVPKEARLTVPSPSFPASRSFPGATFLPSPEAAAQILRAFGGDPRFLDRIRETDPKPDRP